MRSRERVRGGSVTETRGRRGFLNRADVSRPVTKEDMGRNRLMEK